MNPPIVNHDLIRQDVARCLSALVTSIDGIARSRDGIEWNDMTTFDTIVQQAINSEGKLSLTLTRDILLEPKGFSQMVAKKGGPIIVGGGGIVFKCSPPNLPQVEHAFKITRPSLIEGDDGEDEFAVTRNEFLNHAPLSHHNITRVFDGDVIEIKGAPRQRSAHIVPSVPLPAMRMEWIRGAQTLSQYLLSGQNTLNHRDVIRLLIQTFDGLHALHLSGLIHCDIKSDNILVSEDGIVKISDLGNAIFLEINGTTPRTIKTSEWNLPAILLNTITKSEDSKRVQATFPSVEYASAWLDMHMLGKELNRLFTPSNAANLDNRKVKHFPDSRKVEAFISKAFPESDKNARFSLRCIRLLVQCLLAPSKPGVDNFYQNANALSIDLRKIMPEFGAAQNVEELRSIPQNVIKLPTNGNVALTKNQRILVDSKPIARLRRHRQLATVEHAFPGAIHTRFEHVNGVAWNSIAFVRALYSDRDNPLWRILMDEFDVKALITAALFHDVGHIAFGHYLEELSSTFRGITHEDYAVALMDESRPGRFKTRANTQLAADRKATLEAIQEAWNLEEAAAVQLMQFIAQIIQPVVSYAEGATCAEDLLCKTETRQQIKIMVLHSIINGPIDCDKMDYLARDAHHCGVIYGGGIDRDRFFQGLTAFLVSHTESKYTAQIGVSLKGLLPVESMLMGRYQMFSAVYWHKTTRAETAMLKTVLLYFLHGHEAAEREKILDIILDDFRCSEDAGALLRFERFILPGPNVSGERSMHFTEDDENFRDRLAEMIRALLNRDKKSLYKNTFELRYRPQAADQAIINHYKDLVDEATRILTTDKLLDDYSFNDLAVKSFMRAFNESTHVKEDASLMLERLDVIIDMPPFGKDQVRNLYIDHPNNPISIFETSGIAAAMADTFRYWARVLRVFIHPVKHEAIQEFLRNHPNLTKSSLFAGPCERMFQDLHVSLGGALGTREIEFMLKAPLERGLST
ncbi:MAG: protein kinase domain-containing protein [Verrucomicrobiales bacterium]